MKITRRLRSMMKKVTVGFYRRLRNDPNHKFINNAYYVTINGALIDLKPYYGWKNAYRHAKAKHSKAFFVSGRKMNAALSSNQWGAHKRAWSSYGA